MRLTIQLSNGRSAEAILLVASTNVLRVAIIGHDDAVVFQWVSGQWRWDTGEAAEIEFVDYARESPCAPCDTVTPDDTAIAYALAAEIDTQRAVRSFLTN
jgi:hypothetical protein